MNCDDIDRQMEAMLDGALDQQAERSIKTHLSFCPTCQSKWEQLKGLRSLLQKTTTSAPSEALESRVMSAFHRKHASERSVGTRWSISSLLPGQAKPVFAVLLIAMMIAALTGAFILGRVTAKPLVMIPPAAPSKDGTSPQGSRAPVGPEPLVGGGLRRPITATPSASFRRIPTKAQRQARNLIESFSSVSKAGATYSTTTALPGFEPATGASARVIKGDEQQ